MAFDPQSWNKQFLASPGYNDAQNYGAQIKTTPGATWRVIGVHHLSGAENMGNHHIYCDVLAAGGERVNLARLRLLQGQQAPVYAVIDKPANEPGTNFPLWGETPATVMVAGATSDSVSGLRINHADEEIGNTIGHHSFYVVWQAAAGVVEPEPEPEPPAETVSVLTLRVKREDLLKISPDAAGFIELVFDVQGPK